MEPVLILFDSPQRTTSLLEKGSAPAFAFSSQTKATHEDRRCGRLKDPQGPFRYDSHQIMVQYLRTLSYGPRIIR